MPLKISVHSIDFARDQAQLTLTSSPKELVTIICPLPTAGDQTEAALKAASKEAAVALLRQAIAALSED